MKNKIKEQLTILLKSYLTDFKIKLKDIDKIAAKMHPLTLEKGDIFLTEGQTCRKLGVLVNGLLQAYYGIDKTNISRFFYTPNNMIVTSFDSFKYQKPSNETIIALEQSTLFYFDFYELNKLYQEVPAMNIIGRDLAEDSYINALHRIHQLQSLEAKERTKLFYQNSSELLPPRLEIQQIASYLKIHRNHVGKYFKEFSHAT